MLPHKVVIRNIVDIAYFPTYVNTRKLTPSTLELAMTTVANEIGTRPAFTHKRAQSAHHVPADQPGSERSRRGLAMINLIGGVAAFGLAVSPLHAGELSAMAAESVDLGRLHGVLYYTNENDGYRVIATLADGEAGDPMRFSATLAEGQSATISVPGKLGEPDQRLEMLRSGDKLTVTEAGSMSNQSIGAITE
jgi:hypothetical protein